MEKRKEKPKMKRWARQTFDFISSYPVDLCAHLLSTLDGQAQHYPLSPNFLPPSSELSVEILSIDEDSCEFRMKWRDKRRPGYIRFSYASATGYLKRWDSNSTHVVGSTQVARWYATWNIIAWIIATGIFIVIGYTSTRYTYFLCLPVFWTVMIGIMLYQLFRVRQKLLDILEDVLQPIPETAINPTRPQQ